MSDSTKECFIMCITLMLAFFVLVTRIQACVMANTASDAAVRLEVAKHSSHNVTTITSETGEQQ